MSDPRGRQRKPKGRPAKPGKAATRKRAPGGGAPLPPMQQGPREDPFKDHDTDGKRPRGG